jgi:hypothetical protein
MTADRAKPDATLHDLLVQASVYARRGPVATRTTTPRSTPPCG